MELQPVLRTEPIVRPRVGALALPSDPASDQIPVVGVAASKATVDIEETMLDDGPPSRQIRVEAFHSQVQLRNARNLVKVQPRCESCFIPRKPGIHLVIREGVGVKGKPISYFRNSIGQTELTTTVSGVGRAPRRPCRCCRKHSLQEIVSRKRNPISSNQYCCPHT